jgi:hypothetical protein
VPGPKTHANGQKRGDRMAKQYFLTEKDGRCARSLTLSMCLSPSLPPRLSLSHRLSVRPSICLTHSLTHSLSVALSPQRTFYGRGCSILDVDADGFDDVWLSNADNEDARDIFGAKECTSQLFLADADAVGAGDPAAAAR